MRLRPASMRWHPPRSRSRSRIAPSGGCSGCRVWHPLRDVVRPPYRPDPNRGPGRPRQEIEEDLPEAVPPPLPPLTPIERRAFDYTALEEAMAHLDAVVRASRSALRPMADGTHAWHWRQIPRQTVPKRHRTASVSP